MSDEPSFDFLPWEELPVGVRRNRKKMYNYLVSVLGGDTPTPTGTGTVTVTCVDSEDNPIKESSVLLSTEPIDFSSQDDTGFVAYGQTGTDGTVTLTLWDSTTHQPTQDTDVPYGTYYFGGFNGDGEIRSYTGTLTVDGDETVTITLTE